jgi:hypothetical protein
MFSAVCSGERVARAPHVRPLNRVLTAALFTSILLAPLPAAAVTVDQIVALSKAGVSETVILALLDRDRTVLSIDPDQVVTLKREGLSDSLILAMLRSGREEAEEAAQAVSADKAASILATLPLSSSLPAPDLVIVGHGPERPNTGYSSTGFRTGRARGVYEPAFPVLPYGPEFGYSNGSAYKRGLGFNTHRVDPYGQQMLCVAQVNTPRGPGPSYVTECPAVMQRPYRARRRCRRRRRRRRRRSAPTRNTPG